MIRRKDCFMDNGITTKDIFIEIHRKPFNRNLKKHIQHDCTGSLKLTFNQNTSVFTMRSRGWRFHHWFKKICLKKQNKRRFKKKSNVSSSLDSIILQLEQVIMPKDLDGLGCPILSSSLQLSVWFVSDGGVDS